MNLTNKEISLYGLLLLCVAVFIFSVAIWFSSWKSIMWMFSQDHIGVYEKFAFLLTFYGSLATNFSILSASTTILLSILFGINVVLFVHYVRIMRGFGGVETAGATSLGGVFSGFFGIGCASCGSILAFAILSQFGAASFLFLLPFGGQEFSFIAIALLIYSIQILYKKIRAPLVCDV